MNDHLPKPFDKNVLLDKVRRWGKVAAALPRAGTSPPPLAEPRGAERSAERVSADPAASPASGQALAGAAFAVAPTRVVAPALDLQSLYDSFSEQAEVLSDLGDMLFQLVLDFASKIGELEDRLARAAADQDVRAIARLAHDLVGSGGNLGFRELCGAAQRLQRLCYDDPQVALVSLEPLRQQLQVVAAFAISGEFARLRAASVKHDAAS